MSNPSYGPAGQPGAVPTNGTSYPGAAAPQGYGAPAPVVMPKLPGRGGAVTVTADGVFMVRGDAHKDSSCSLIGADGKSHELEPYPGSEDVYLAENLPAGSYVLHCDGIANGANITAFNASPEVVTKVFAMPFVWGTVVGVAGLIVLIVGIVLLVNVNGKRRRITQEAMLGAVR